MTTSVPRRRILYAFGMAPLLVACAPIAPGGGGSGAGPVTASNDQLDPEAVLRYADTSSPSRFDPHRSTVGQDIRFFTPVYDRLVHLSPDGQPIPGLATSWTWEEDGRALRMELRQGVRFHDGTPFDAEAVRANVERGKTVPGTSVGTDLANVESVEVAGPSTVVLRLSQPTAMLPGLLSHRAGAMVSPAAFADPDLDLRPVGTGMYRVTDYQPNNVIVYERNPDYWDDTVVGVRRLELRILTDEVTRMNALRTGEVDIALLNGRLGEEARGLPGVTVHQKVTLAYAGLLLNRARSQFADVRVRRAMNLAIDRPAIVAGVYFGAGEATVQPFPSTYYAHNPDFPADHYARDLARARALLAEAGHPNGFDFEMLVPSLTAFVQLAEAMQRMLAEVGIRARLRSVEVAQAGDVFYSQRDGDSLIAQWGGRPDPSMTIGLQYMPGGFANPGAHTTARLEELQRRALSTLDRQEREAAVREASGEIADQALDVPVIVEATTYATTERVANFSTLVTGQPDFRTLGALRTP
ncbi:ABC transporter substrate-binding protein [Pseudonocardia pini]|uniref:ABC transporter substrate-binding protein n=1 Tax=Pseudonocardia pini TaxID=2758030 RepID=UPI0015F0501E|nr:ABC transporter substrate-binding protein [Pseudonocardia pini]